MARMIKVNFRNIETKEFESGTKLIEPIYLLFASYHTASNAL